MLKMKVTLPYLQQIHDEDYIHNYDEFLSEVKDKLWSVLVCGGGRKNLTLIESIKKEILEDLEIQSIDNYLSE